MTRGRLTSATNPESGTAGYTYYNNQNLKTKTQGSGTGPTIGYVYDHLDRLTSKTYSDSTPPVTLCYDYITITNGNCVKGSSESYLSLDKPTIMTNSNSTTILSKYDALGRVTQSSQVLGTQTYPFTYTYNVQSQLTSLGYPSGRVVKTMYDSAGRISGVQNNGSSLLYASSLSYAANGAIAGLIFGDGLAETTTFNSRFQATSINAGSLLTVGYGYGSSQNNGNVLSQTITRSGSNTQFYAYDGFNRLAIAAENPSSQPIISGQTCASFSSSWCQTYLYDNYGNRALHSSSMDPSSGVSSLLVASTGSTTAVPFNTNNQWTAPGATYDALGNLISVSASPNSVSASYDAENRQISFTSVIGGTTTTTDYGYDGSGHRVSKNIGGATTSYVYDVQGNLAAEYSSVANPDSGTLYLTADALGSTRLITTAVITNGQVTPSAVSQSDYLPFGQEIPSTWGGRNSYITDSSETIKFTSKERDAETGLDYFEARYYSGAQGRFTSPDPVGANLIRVLNPQRWNKYAYVINNPLAFTDPNGKDAIAVGLKTLAAGAGHAAVISVHPDGSATFGSYGPRGGRKPVWAGEYVVQPLQTKVTFGSDGTPTTGSFSVLAGEVADIEKVDPSSVDMDYFKTSDAETAALDQYLDSVKGTKSLYVVGVHDCIFVCNTALGRAGIGTHSEFADVPRWVIWNLGFTSDSTYSGETGEKKQNDRKRDKPDVHSTVHFCTNENDSSCQQ